MFDSVFSCYAKHQSELDNIVREIYVNGGQKGNLDVSSLDDLSFDDLQYISSELKKKGLDVKLSLQ